MNLQDTVALIEALRIAGVKRFKSHEHEIDLTGDAKPVQPTIKTDQPLTPAESAAEADARKKIQEMIKTLNMTPDQMAKAMFPEDI